jgi:hypothetical protein
MLVQAALRMSAVYPEFIEGLRMSAVYLELVERLPDVGEGYVGHGRMSAALFLDRIRVKIYVYFN